MTKEEATAVIENMKQRVELIEALIKKLEKGKTREDYLGALTAFQLDIAELNEQSGN